MNRRPVLRALLAAALVAAGLEALARALEPAPGPSVVNSEGFRDREWKLERTPGLRRLAVTGAAPIEDLDRPLAATFAKRLERRLGRAEVLDMTGAPLERALEACARYRPDLIIHGLEAPRAPAWSCPSRALAFAVTRGRALLEPPDEEPGIDPLAVARTRALCELRERAASFGAAVTVLVFPDGGRFAERALRSCDAAGVRALLVAGDPVERLAPTLAP